MKELASSPEKGSFSINCEKKKIAEKPDDPDVVSSAQQMIEWYEEATVQQREREQDPNWQKDNLEYDLRSTDWVVEKCKNDVYAQNVYAALCNMEWQRTEVFPVLRDERWGCSWRYAGGVVADLRGEGDYMDWYCSGIGATGGFVSEGIVTDEIAADFKRLGWHPVP